MSKFANSTQIFIQPPIQRAKKSYISGGKGGRNV